MKKTKKSKTQQKRAIRSVSFCFALTRFVAGLMSVVQLGGCVMDKSLNIRLKKFASDLSGELGQIQFERVLRRHLDLFRDLRTSGVTWQMIATALANVGVLRRDKLPMSAAQIRGVVSRQLARSDRGDEIGGLSEPVLRPSPARASEPMIDASAVATTSKRASKPPLHTAVASRSVQLDPGDQKQAADVGMSAPPVQTVPPPATIRAKLQPSTFASTWHGCEASKTERRRLTVVPGRSAH